jgi:hypothetical protein
VEVAEGVRCAVVGHVEWVDFVPVERVPEPGEILTTKTTGPSRRRRPPRRTARLGAETTFFTAVGRTSWAGRAEEALRATALLEVAVRADQRRALTYLTRGECTITVLGEKLYRRGRSRGRADETACVPPQATRRRSARRGAPVLAATARAPLRRPGPTDAPVQRT